MQILEGILPKPLQLQPQMTDSQNPLELIHDKILDGDVDAAIDELRVFLKVNDISSSKVDTTVDMLKMRMSSLKRDIRMGLVRSDDARVEGARIAHAILETVKDLKVKLPAKPPAPSNEMPDEMPDMAFEKIIGPKSNLKSISWLENGLKMAKSVCRIVTDESFGTGFLTADNWLYTNNHVLESADRASKSEAQFNYNQTISGNLERFHSYKLDSSTFFTSKDNDFTRVKVIPKDGNPDLSEWGTLTINEVLPEVGEHVTIIQHPRGEWKQIALNENRILGYYSRYMHYSTDTQPGSSGSPVFNDDWEVVAIHHAGGNVRMNDQGEKRFANEAVLFREINKLL